MSRKRQIPGVDENALAALAEQFPSSAVPARDAQSRDERRKTIRAVPPVDPASPVAPIPPVEEPPDQPFPPIQPAAAAESRPVAPPKSRGRGLAVAALKLASVAVLLAAAVFVPPQTRLWLTQKLHVPEIARAVAVSNDPDPRLAAAVQSIGVLEDRTAGVASRLDALEAAAATNGLAQRVAVLEANLKAVGERSAGDPAADRAAAAQADALDTRLAAFDSDLKKVQDSLAATTRNVDDMLGARIGIIEADIGVLQNSDRRPEKFFLAALQLRDAARTASPFAREVGAARSLAGVNPDLLAALEVLAANSQSGVATVVELRESFSTMVAPRLAAAAAANRQPLTERAWGWVGSLFTTAASPAAADDRNGTLIALAARSLEQGQLAAAVHQLLLLEDEPALLAAEWLKDASTRLAVDKAIATIMAQALDQLAALEQKN